MARGSMRKPHNTSQDPDRLPADASTRDRILKSAVLRFSTQSYDSTSLRDLAADVGVDVAYVHRCFGSKENLFRAAVTAVYQSERLFSGDRESLAATLGREVLSKRQENEVRPLDIIIRSFSSADASGVLRDFVMEDFVLPLQTELPSVSQQQAALVAAFLAGVGILRDVIGAVPLQEQEGGELERAVVYVIDAIMSAAPDWRRPDPQRSFIDRRMR